MGSFLMLGLGLVGIAEVAATTKEEAVRVREGVTKEVGALPLVHVAGDEGEGGGRGGSGGAEEVHMPLLLDLLLFFNLLLARITDCSSLRSIW